MALRVQPWMDIYQLVEQGAETQVLSAISGSPRSQEHLHLNLQCVRKWKVKSWALSQATQPSLFPQKLCFHKSNLSSLYLKPWLLFHVWFCFHNSGILFYIFSWANQTNVHMSLLMYSCPCPCPHSLFGLSSLVRIQLNWLFLSPVSQNHSRIPRHMST